MDAATLKQFQSDVARYLRSDYMLPSGEVIKGQSLTHLQQCLRMGENGRRWQLRGGYCGFTDALEKAGFKLVRARTMRYTRKGDYKPYQQCEVVTN